MGDIFFSLCYSCITFLLHIIWHKQWYSGQKGNIRSARIFLLCTLMYFPLNVVLHSVLSDLFVVPLRLTGFLLYCFIVTFYAIYFVSALLGEESPSGRIYSYIKNHSRASESELLKLLPEKSMIGDRLGHLLKSGYIRKQAGTYVITQKGKRVLIPLSLYRSLVGADEGG